MNWFDYAIVGVLALSVLIGLWRGFIGEVLALVCWILAFWVSWTFGPVLAEQFSASISVPSVRLILGYALCFVAVLIAGALVGFVMRKLVSGSGLSGTDRLLGMLFGLARGAVLVVLVVLMMKFTAVVRDDWWQNSRLLPTFDHGARWITARLPENIAKYLEPAAALALPAMPQPAATPEPNVDAVQPSTTPVN